jgi:dihydroorotase-like cyclic amidohydrolase
MPNTQPPVTDAATLETALAAARSKARCDYGQYLGAGADNIAEAAALAPHAAGLKMYLDQTYGPLRLDDMTDWQAHFERWPGHLPIVAHAESRTLAAVILLAALFDRSVHLAHVSLAEEILLIRRAKKRGLKVTCEVAPHHLFLSNEVITKPQIAQSSQMDDDAKSASSAVPGLRLSFGRSEVRPRLATPADVQALWDNLDVIDCFATDHAPHTVVEKDGSKPPPGFPGLETALPLLLTAVDEGRMTLDDLVARMVTNPRRIFNLPEQPDTWIEVDPDAEYEIRAADAHTRCGWTPFEGRRVRGRVERVVLRGQIAYENGTVLAAPGAGQNVRAVSPFAESTNG